MTYMDGVSTDDVGRGQSRIVRIVIWAMACMASHPCYGISRSGRLSLDGGGSIAHALSLSFLWWLLIKVEGTGRDLPEVGTCSTGAVGVE